MLLMLLLVPSLCAAESTLGSTSASSHLSFRVVIPPVFRVLQVTPMKESYHYRVWTNMPSILLNGVEYRFKRVGENHLTIPAPPAGVFVVHGL
ncbi:hypothetical protein QTI24_15900 [Variovorax sp. J22P240]|uniref:hypothetical protein n=1 Tax=Variovorax sp. J22P240 TaxID=3053514 RepID=UPI0025750E08|nr:hypothetical protein [Variovorax sp. J22P240]MDM0000102.1 hypothetical protein [Variovorax sp. J22P240]